MIEHDWKLPMTMSLTRSTAVVIGLTPSFAVLVRAGRNAIRKPDADEQEVQLTTIGGSGGSRNRKEIQIHQRRG